MKKKQDYLAENIIPLSTTHNESNYTTTPHEPKQRDCCDDIEVVPSKVNYDFLEEGERKTSQMFHILLDKTRLTRRFFLIDLSLLLLGIVAVCRPVRRRCNPRTTCQ